MKFGPGKTVSGSSRGKNSSGWPAMVLSGAAAAVTCSPQHLLGTRSNALQTWCEEGSHGVMRNEQPAAQDVALRLQSNHSQVVGY